MCSHARPSPPARVARPRRQALSAAARIARAATERGSRRATTGTRQAKKLGEEHSRHENAPNLGTKLRGDPYNQRSSQARSALPGLGTRGAVVA